MAQEGRNTFLKGSPSTIPMAEEFDRQKERHLIKRL
jgi:hypothetical protein